MRRVRQDDRELELRLGASISVHRLSSQETRVTAIPNALGTPTRSQNRSTDTLRPGHQTLTSGLPRVREGLSRFRLASSERRPEVNPEARAPNSPPGRAISVSFFTERFQIYGGVIT